MEMTGYCKIENEGEVELNAFRLLGASTKENDDTKIGYFGSGIKYAIASALREEIPLRVFSGKKEIKISTNKETMGDMEFDVICINGAPTSLTTRMGKDWKPWFIFREFYCNAIDAGGMELGVDGEPSGVEGKTRIYLGVVPKMKAVLDNFDAFFSERRTPFLEVHGNKVFHARADSMSVYRKGILVFRHQEKSLYDYDFSALAIDEARTASDYDCQRAIVDFWKTSATGEMIESLGRDSSFELTTLNWNYGWHSYSNVWLTQLKGKVIIPREHGGQYIEDFKDKAHIILPHAMCQELHRQFGDELTIRGFAKENKEKEIIEKTPKMETFISEGLAFLKKAGIIDIESFPISVAKLDKNIFGTVEGDTILLSPELFDHGKREVVKTLLEEYVHCKTNASDETRFMQETLLNMVVAAYEEKSGTYL